MIRISTLNHYEDPNLQKAFRQYYDDLGIVDFKYWDRLFIDMEKEENLNTFVLLDKDEIIGFIQCQSIELKDWFFKEHIGFIRELWVKAQVRHQGYGDQLVNHVIEKCTQQGLKKIILTTENANSFYKKHGFIHDASYSASNDDMVMIRMIN